NNGSVFLQPQSNLCRLYIRVGRPASGLLELDSAGLPGRRHLAVSSTGPSRRKLPEGNLRRSLRRVLPACQKVRLTREREGTLPHPANICEFVTAHVANS